MKKSLYRKAFTLVELTMVIGIVLGMAGMSVFGMTYFTSLARANRAEAVLKQVEKARLSYLIDHPTHSYREITGSNISKYLPGGFSAMQDILRDNGYDVSEGDLRTATIGYTSIDRRGPQWTLPIRGFCCSNCDVDSGGCP
jgi:type II secretory pathway pseudopilin PulG